MSTTTDEPLTVLGADIGGTKTLLCVSRSDGDQPQRLFERRYDSQRYRDFAAVLAEFNAEARERGIPLPAAACVAAAGPIIDSDGGQRVKITNLPWALDTAALADALGTRRVRLINDFQGIGYALETLEPAQLAVLQPGTPVTHGARAVIGAGTGLGMAIAVWCGGRYEVAASEGGHAGFAPTGRLQRELLEFLEDRHGHVSWETVLSGPGLERLYDFFRTRQHQPHGARPDSAAAISRAALAGSDPVAGAALDLFVAIYGAQAGNLALTTAATGGLYVGGGIAPRIIARLRAGGFIRAFVDHPPMAALLERIPVRVVLEPNAGVIGATVAALRLVKET